MLVDTEENRWVVPRVDALPDRRPGAVPAIRLLVNMTSPAERLRGRGQDAAREVGGRLPRSLHREICGFIAARPDSIYKIGLLNGPASPASHGVLRTPTFPFVFRSFLPLLEMMMNITDLISSQLMTPEVLGKLGGLIGASESQTRSATSAAVPALLSAFGKTASTNSGADQLAKAMGGLDLGMLGNIAGLLGGSQAQGLGNVGGNLLTSLLGGGNMLSSLVGTLASFAGVQPGIMKTLLTYLAPMVLGMVAKQFTGRPDAAGVARLFSEQAGNIQRAVPKGLSLADLGSVSGRPSEPARHGGHSHEPQPSGGLPGWLLPLLALRRSASAGTCGTRTRPSRLRKSSSPRRSGRSGRRPSARKRSSSRRAAISSTPSRRRSRSTPSSSRRSASVRTPPSSSAA